LLVTLEKSPRCNQYNDENAMGQIPLLKKVGDNIFLKSHSHGQCSLSFPKKRLYHCSLPVEMV